MKTLTTLTLIILSFQSFAQLVPLQNVTDGGLSLSYRVNREFKGVPFSHNALEVGLFQDRPYFATGANITLGGVQVGADLIGYTKGVDIRLNLTASRDMGKVSPLIGLHHYIDLKQSCFVFGVVIKIN